MSPISKSFNFNSGHNLLQCPQKMANIRRQQKQCIILVNAHFQCWSVCARHVYCFQSLKTRCTVYSTVISTQGQQLFYHSVEIVNRFLEIWPFSIIGFYSELNLDFCSSKGLEPMYVLQVSVIIIHIQACFIITSLCTFNLTHSV